MKPTKIILVASLISAIYGCSRSSEEHLSSAESLLAESKHKAAIVELKNALKEDPNNARARLILGQVYFKEGLFEFAIKELEKANEVGQLDAESISMYLQSLHNVGNFYEVNTFVSNQELSSTIESEIYVRKGMANLMAGNKSEAKEQFLQSSEISDSKFAKLASIYLYALENHNNVISELQSLLEAYPVFKEAIFLQGQVFLQNGDFESAASSFSSYLELSPYELSPKLYLADAHIKNGNYQEAKTQLDKIFKINAKNPYANGLYGLVKFESEEFEDALLNFEFAIQNNNDTFQNKLLAGLSAFRTNKLELAYKYLFSIADQLPENHPALTILAMVQLQLGDASSSLQTLSQKEYLTNNDVNLLTSAVYQQIKSGEIEDKSQALVPFDLSGIEDSNSLTQLGMLQLQIDSSLAVKTLEKSIQSDPSNTRANIVLANAYILNEKFDKALNLARSWKGTDLEVEGINLQALIALIKKDETQAKALYKSAMTVNEQNRPSLLFFMDEAIKNNNLDAAIDYIHTLLTIDSTDLRALSTYLQLMTIKDTYSNDKAINYFKNGYVDSDNNSEQLNLYLSALLQNNMLDTAIDAVSNYNGSVENKDIMYRNIVNNLLNKGEFNKAEEAANLWIEALPQSELAKINLIKTYELSNKFTEAFEFISTSIKDIKQSAPLEIIYAQYLVSYDKHNEAEGVISQLPEQIQSLDVVKGIKGEIALNNGNVDQALEGLIPNYLSTPSERNALLVYTAYKQKGDTGKAIEFLEEHIKTQQNDFNVINVLASYFLTKDADRSLELHNKLLKAFPENLSFLNNTAYLLYQKEKNEEALQLIERALALPSGQQDADVLDTAGMIQFALGDKDKALEHLNKAAELAPNNKLIQKNLEKVKEQSK